eukprot:Opistho-1_new@10702
MLVSDDIMPPSAAAAGAVWANAEEINTADSTTRVGAPGHTAGRRGPDCMRPVCVRSCNPRLGGGSGAESGRRGKNAALLAPAPSRLRAASGSQPGPVRLRLAKGRQRRRPLLLRLRQMAHLHVAVTPDLFRNTPCTLR